VRRGWGMVPKLNKEIGEYYRLAAEAREKASAATDPVTRQRCLDRERRWLLFAYRHQFAAPRKGKGKSGLGGPSKHAPGSHSGGPGTSSSARFR
jgi:hypothetical protein